MTSQRTTIVFAAILTAIILPMSAVGVAYAGSGSSNSNHATIDLYDNGTKPPGGTLTLSDSYSACWGGCGGSFTATVYADKTTVTWDANDTYWHSWYTVHDFSGGQIQHEGQTYNIPSNSASGSHDFNNTGMSPYSVDVEFYYD